MEELIFKNKLGEFYISPTKLSKEDKNVQYLIEIDKKPLLLFMDKHEIGFYRAKLVTSDYKFYNVILIKLKEDFDHTDIKSLKKYSDIILSEIKEQAKSLDKIINDGDL